MKIDCYPQPKTFEISTLRDGSVGYWEEEERMLMVCSTWGDVPIKEKVGFCVCIELGMGTISYIPDDTEVIPMDVKLVLDE